MRFGLSTSWNAYRHDAGAPLILEIQEAGFDSVELSFNLTSAMVRQVRDLVVQGRVKVLSLHNYCPVPELFPREQALPDSVSLASCNEEERALAVKFTVRTIDTAAELGAKAVVLHCGRVEMPDKTRELIRMHEAGMAGSEAFVRVREEHRAARSQAADGHFYGLLRSMDTLVAHASVRGITLGVENRFYFREIPSPDEISRIMERFEGAPVVYWHDTGHARVMEQLGFAGQAEYLDRHAKYLGGMHLHDVAGCRDHLPLGSGDLDFSRILSFAPEKAILILEIHKPAAAQQLADSRQRLTALLNERH
jgi:sugar phosphate isomerase/epimerase